MRGRLGVLAALFLAALALRPQLVGVGPLLPEIQDELSLSHAAAGLLGTIPVVCLGLFAPPAGRLAGLVGGGLAIAAAIAAIAVFGVARALAPGVAALVVLTLPVGIGMGLAGALLPVVVKERFPDRPAFATGVYATAINLGSALSAALAVPVAHAAGGWRASLLAYSVATAGLLVGWIVLARPQRLRAEAAAPRLPVRSRVAWLLAAVFGVEAIVFYGLVSWLPDAYVERGWSEGDAGALVAVLSACALPAGLLVPWAAERRGSRRAYLAGASALLAAATIGVLAAPSAGWLWAALAGIAIGAHFPLSLTLPLDVADRPADVGAVAALMLSAGYVLAAVSPLGLGAVRDASGSFTPALALLAGLSVVLVATCVPLTRERLQGRPEELGVALQR